MMKRLLSFVLLSMTVVSAMAVSRAVGGFVTVKQKDGKQLTLKLKGDADVHYNVTMDGALLYQDGTDYYVAVIDADGNMSSSGVLAHNSADRTSEETALMAAQDRDKFYAQAEETRIVRRAVRREPVSTNLTFLAHVGSPKVLVILADFADQKFKHSDDSTIAIFNQYLNCMGDFDKDVLAMDSTLGENYYGVRRYFSDMSFEDFQPQFDIKAVVHLGGNMGFYGEGTSDRMDRFIPAVCDSAFNQGVDFSEYDQNGDGNVDLLYVIYAGYGANYGGVSDDAIWPKSGIYSSKTYNGKRIYRYGVNNELNFYPDYSETPYINGVGVFCHELCHCLGIPDFYSTSTTAQQAYVPTMEYFSIMDAGEYGYNGYIPTALTAWEREALGWITIDTLTDDMAGKRITLTPIDKGGKAYRLFKDGETSGSEYMVLECIESVGWNNWLADILGHGMVVTHVDYNSAAFANNNVNNTIGHPRMSVVSASGEYFAYNKYLDLTASDTTTEAGLEYIQGLYTSAHNALPFPGTSNVTQVDSFSVYSGTMTKPLLEITENTRANTVSFWFMKKGLDTELALTESVASSYIYTDTVVVKGVLRDENNKVISNVPISVKCNGGYISSNTTYTDSEGMFSTAIVCNTIGDYILNVYYEGNDSLHGDTLDAITFNVGKISTHLVIDGDISYEKVTAGQSNTISGVLLDSKGNAVQNATIAYAATISDKNVSGTATTDSNGKFSFSLTTVENGTVNVSVSYAGEGGYAAAETVNVSLITTDINGILMEESGTDVYHTLDGRSMNKSQIKDGIYIYGGKKIIVH